MVHILLLAIKWAFNGINKIKQPLVTVQLWLSSKPGFPGIQYASGYYVLTHSLQGGGGITCQTPLIQKTLSPKEGLPHPQRMDEEGYGEIGEGEGRVQKEKKRMVVQGRLRLVLYSLSCILQLLQYKIDSQKMRTSGQAPPLSNILPLPRTA